MELTFCIVLPLVVFGLLIGIPLALGGYQLVSSIECKKRRELLRTGYKLSLLSVMLVAGYLALTNITLVSCDKRDSISRLLNKEPVQLAGLPCPCGCGGHKK